MMVCSANKNLVLDQALHLNERGIPLTLCRENKRPIGKEWQHLEYDADAIEREFGSDPDLSVGIVLGARSGIVDFEGDEDSSEADLRELFDGNIPETPSFRSRRGVHRLFAWNSDLERIQKASSHYKTVELRIGASGKAAHSLVAPSKTDGVEREWIVTFDDCEPAQIPKNVLRKIAPPEKPEKVVDAKVGAIGKKGRPGDDFNANGPSWLDILSKHSWTCGGNNGEDVSFFTRPGKCEGISATAGYCKTDGNQDLLYVFSSNAAPLEAGHCYTKFSAYAVLNHGGDFSAAAADLAEQGYEGEKSAGRDSVAKTLIDMVTSDEGAELFHTSDNLAHVSFEVDGHSETAAVSSTRFRQYLSSRYYRERSKVANSSAVKDALSTLEGIAMYDGPERDVHLRIAQDDDAIWIDRGSPEWDAYKVTANGWNLLSSTPVRFWRPKSMLSLPIATRGGTIEELRSLVNVPDDQFPLVIGTLLAYLRPIGPYPCSLIVGEHGTCKSTLAKLMRCLFDPNSSPLKGEPKDLKALMVSARNNRGIVFDNLSKLTQWQSDGFCRLATGGGISDRELYTNGEEYILEAQRPVIVTSICNVATREDLIDRSVILELDPISKANRKREADYWREVEEKLPAIFGALLDGISCALRRFDDVHIDDLPRMADFATWVTAAEPAFGWQEGKFMGAYTGNQADAHMVLLESPVAQAVIRLIDKAIHWEGTATELHAELSSGFDRGPLPEKWPKEPIALGSELTRISPTLREVGYLCDRGRDNQRRGITLSRSCDGISA